MRLDAHSHAVPEEVFALLERWAPRCPHLRGITLERMEGTVADPSDVAGLRAELERIRALADTLETVERPATPVPPAGLASTPDDVERAIAASTAGAASKPLP